MSGAVNGPGPVTVAVCGVKNSGKTTFLCGLIPELAALGIKAAAIKHDGHDFDPDVPGTDSYRLRAAGAKAVAVYSKTRFMLVREAENISPGYLSGMLGDADIVLLEGGKDSRLPKIEIVRAAVSRVPVCDPEGLLAVCTDIPERIQAPALLALDGYAAAARLLRDYILAQKAKKP